MGASDLNFSLLKCLQIGGTFLHLSTYYQCHKITVSSSLKSKKKKKSPNINITLN